MITNILVVAAIIFAAIFVAAYKSKRQQPPEPIILENGATAPATGSFEYIKETATNDTGGYSPPTI